MYVVIEGVDTCGKSTQISMLKEALPDAIFTKEPGGTQIGQKFREILLGDYVLDKRAEFLLFLADRAQHRMELLEPNIALGRDVISDRGMLSGLAYSSRSFDDEFLIGATEFSMGTIRPDLVVLLELEQAELVARLGIKEHDRIEKQGVKYLLEVQENIEKYAEKLNIQLLKIPAKLSIADICAQIIKKIKA